MSAFIVPNDESNKEYKTFEDWWEQVIIPHRESMERGKESVRRRLEAGERNFIACPGAVGLWIPQRFAKRYDAVMSGDEPEPVSKNSVGQRVGSYVPPETE